MLTLLAYFTLLSDRPMRIEEAATWDTPWKLRQIRDASYFLGATQFPRDLLDWETPDFWNCPPMERSINVAQVVNSLKERLR